MTTWGQAHGLNTDADVPFVFSLASSLSLIPHTMSFSPLYTVPTAQDRDLATLSNYLDIRTTHIDLVWAIDWESKTFGGSATLDLEATKDGVDTVVLDTSYLDVKDVQVDGAKAEWKLDDRIDVMGQALRVKLPKSVSKGSVGLYSCDVG